VIFAKKKFCFSAILKEGIFFSTFFGNLRIAVGAAVWDDQDS
jgi:hypothetical protein